MSKPKEDPADRRARLRERRLSEVDRQVATEANAASLASDLRAIYGNLAVKPKMPGMKVAAK